jgi:hypothetical protein
MLVHHIEHLDYLVQLHIDIENMLNNVIANQKAIVVVTKICGSKVGRKEVLINYVVI